jgi:hypothetical protein
LINLAKHNNTLIRRFGESHRMSCQAWAQIREKEGDEIFILNRETQGQPDEIGSTSISNKED